MSQASKAPTPETSLLTELCALASDEQREYLRGHPQLVVQESVLWLAEAVRQRVRIDIRQALQAAESALLIAEALGDRACLGHALRAKGNALWFNGQCRPASELMAQAIELFQDLALDDELGRTLSTSIQPLILLSEYEQAQRNAERAREIFDRQQNGLRLARLDINVANIHHRQGHYAEALAVYRRAYRGLLAHRDVEATGVALHNIAVCLISLDDFEHALEAYQEARQVLEVSEMPLLLAQADYNIAHLYYLRGDYERALHGLGSAREIAIHVGDRYHEALCDLDQSEIYLDLNLVEEAGEMTERARAQFESLGMAYERARALTNLAIARSHSHKAQDAIELFEQARAAFAEHKVGGALVDLYQAILLEGLGEFGAARPLVSRAQQVFKSLRLRRKALLCELLACRINLALGEPGRARESCQNVLGELQGMEAPVLVQRAQFLAGVISEALGESERAFGEYEAARRELETVRGGLEREELKIGFVANKLEVYERLIDLCMSRGYEGNAAEQAFEYMERATCRSLADAMFDRTRPGLPRPKDAEAQSRIEKLRAQLNWYYHRIDLEELEQDGPSPERVDRLSEQARQCEDSLAREMREPSYASGAVGAVGSAVMPLEEIRTALAPETVLLQYYQSRDRLLAAVLNRDGVHLVPLGRASSVKKQVNLLQFQLSKVRLHASHPATSEPVTREAATLHLQNLYRDLVTPLQEFLHGRHLAVVPGGFLHYLPFHALHDGEAFLIDRFTVSYAPSASLFALCQQQTRECEGPSLIFGISDSRTPWIVNEVTEVAQAVPDASLFLDAEATREVFERLGTQSRVIHIATHGSFRTDNPMFSWVRLGDSHLNVYDLYRLNLPAELLTLSGCGTGLNVIAAGDELIGLTRGLMHAGAQSLLLSLWDVHDRSTAEFMSVFYRCWQGGATKAAALQAAMQEVRKKWPHPYHWSPFTLVGKAF